MRIVLGMVCAALLSGIVCVRGGYAADAAFDAWLQSLWPQAQQLGVSRATFDMATRGLEPDLSLPELVIPGRPPHPGRDNPNSSRRRRTI